MPLGEGIKSLSPSVSCPFFYQPRLCIPDAIDGTPISLDRLSDWFILSRTKFSRMDVAALLTEMRVPDYFVINAHHPGKAHNFPGEWAFLFTLTRIASSSGSLWSQKDDWYTDLSVLSKIFRVCISWIDVSHSHRLSWISRYQPYFATHNAALIESMCRTGEGQVPAEALDVALFLDATIIIIIRPQVIFILNFESHFSV
jgi:hypothetical protein